MMKAPVRFEAATGPSGRKLQVNHHARPSLVGSRDHIRSPTGLGPSVGMNI